MDLSCCSRSMVSMNVSIVEIFIPNGITRQIALHDGMEATDLKALLLSCFLGCEILGLQNSQGLIYPISMIVRKPSDFGNKRFAAVIKNPVFGMIEDVKTSIDTGLADHMEFESEDRNGYSGSLIEFTHPEEVHSAFVPEKDNFEFKNDSWSIAEAKAVLGLGKYSAEFIIDFLIGKIGDDDASTEESSWLITEQQFDSAMLQLLNRQYIDLTAKQRSLSDYLVHTIFATFDANNSGFCDLTELGCGLMLFSGGEIADRAQMAYKLVAEWHDDEGLNDEAKNEGVKTEMMTTAIASVLKIVAILNSSYLNSCDPLNTADEITKRAFERAKLPISDYSTIGQEDFEYWFSVVLTIYNEIEEEEVEEEQVVKIKKTSKQVKQKRKGKKLSTKLTIDTESAKYNADTDLENGDVRITMAPNAVVLELQVAKNLLGLTGVAAEDLMELLGEVSSEGLLSIETWEEYLSEFVLGSKADKKRGIKLGMKLFNSFDSKHEGEVNYIDFCAGLILLSDSPVEDKVMVAFVLNDTEGVGIISVPELQNLVLGSLRVAISCSPTAAKKVAEGGVGIQELARFIVLEGLAVMELTSEDSLTLETVSEISLKCIALSAK